MRCGTPSLFLLVLVVGGGCSVNDLVGELHPGASENGAYCARPGPVWIQDVKTGRESCVGHLAARAFTRAVCSRGLLTASASFDTGTLGDAPGEASVWAGGDVILNASASVRGSLHVNSPGGLVVKASVSVSGELRCLGPLGRPGGHVTVGGDAWVYGNINLGSLTVGGLLHQPGDRGLNVTGGFPDSQVSHALASPPDFSGTCDSGEDVVALVKRNGPLHHNQVIGLEPGAFADVSHATRSLELPCGRFFLERITGTGEDKGTVQLVVTGRSALFVGGDVDVEGLEVRLMPGAQLDLFIQGGLSARQRLILDSGLHPSRLRLYVGGALHLPPELMLETHLYAPNAQLETGEDLPLSGAMVLGSLTVAGNVAVQSDPELGAVESTCSDAG